MPFTIFHKALLLVQFGKIKMKNVQNFKSLETSIFENEIIFDHKDDSFQINELGIIYSVGSCW